MENKKYTTKEIWDFMPKKFQGFIMGILVFLLVVASSNLLDLLYTNILLIDLSLAIIYIIGIFKVVGIIYPWLSNN